MDGGLMIRKVTTCCAVALVLLATSSCQKLAARDNLVKGMRAFKEGKFDRAAEYFDNAMKKDPDLIQAQLYLGTAYAAQFDPNGVTEDNQKLAENAIKTFEGVLAKDANNVSAVQGLAGLYQGLKNFDKSREYYKKQTEIDPNNPVPYYAIASTNWMVLRDRAHPVPEDQKSPIVEEGLQYVDKALEKDPNYQEAMAYKNLLLRDKAALTKDPAESKRLQDEANVWFNRALDTLKANAEKKANPVGAAK
jgi:tetratricopeptide (TPR) repeat protein